MKPRQLTIPMGDAQDHRVVVMGVDPGFASSGVAIVAQDGDNHPELLHLEVVRTKETPKKEMRNLRVSADDQRRMRELWDKLDELHHVYQPTMVAVETYAPFKGKMGGNAWKGAMVYALVSGFGYANGLVVLPFLPVDLKRGLCGKVSATKAEVEAAVGQKVRGFAEAIAKVPKTQQEHPSDATAHAYLALKEAEQLRQRMGF